jgi:hypothetical protein
MRGSGASIRVARAAPVNAALIADERIFNATPPGLICVRNTRQLHQDFQRCRRSDQNYRQKIRVKF